MPRFYQKSEDQKILEEIKAVISIRATYGYRRVTIMVNRKRTEDGRSKINRKRVQRVMRMNGLSLPQTMPEQKRPHTGVVMTMFPNLRWCSDGMEIRCFNGEKVFVAFALDCCDREAFAYVARTEPLSADDIEELMVKAVESRFGESLRCPREIQWLSDRGSIYRAKSVQSLGKDLNLAAATPGPTAQSPTAWLNLLLKQSREITFIKPTVTAHGRFWNFCRNGLQIITTSLRTQHLA